MVLVLSDCDPCKRIIYIFEYEKSLHHRPPRIHPATDFAETNCVAFLADDIHVCARNVSTNVSISLELEFLSRK